MNTATFSPAFKQQQFATFAKPAFFEDESANKAPGSFFGAATKAASFWTNSNPAGFFDEAANSGFSNKPNCGKLNVIA